MKTNTTILLLAFLFCFSVPANSVLLDNQDGTVTQIRTDGSRLMWLKDANTVYTSGYSTFNNGTIVWSEANNWIDSLNSSIYLNYSDWRLPKTLPVNGVEYNYNFSSDGSTDWGFNIKSLNSEMGYLFYEELGNIGYRATDGSFPQPGWGLSNVGPFVNVQNYVYWSDMEGAPNPNAAWAFDFNRGGQDGVLIENDRYAWAVRSDGYSPIVTAEQSYLTDYLTLGDTFSFDYWWAMGMEPTEFNFDLMVFNGTGWELLGAEWTFGGSSSEWLSASLLVPEWARGLETQIRFSLFDLGQGTDPTVYLANISSNSAPVPEPSTIVLMGLGLVGLAGLGRKKIKI
jgi:hypothetical protein